MYTERVLALILIDPLTSWKKALDNFYSFGEKFINNYIAALNDFNSSFEADFAKEHLKLLNSFIEHYSLEKFKNLSIVQVCEKFLKDSSNINSHEIDLILNELRNDLENLKIYSKKENLWEGWSYGNFRKKYSFYRFQEKDSLLKSEITSDAARIYSPSELEYSKSMESGLTINLSWGENYHILDDIRRTNCEIYYLCGEHDVLFLSKELECFILQKFGTANFIKFHKSSHSPMYEEPELFFKNLLEIYIGLVEKINLENAK